MDFRKHRLAVIGGAITVWQVGVGLLNLVGDIDTIQQHTERGPQTWFGKTMNWLVHPRGWFILLAIATGLILIWFDLSRRKTALHEDAVTHPASLPEESYSVHREWLGLDDALTLLCDPALVWQRESYRGHIAHARQAGERLEREIRELYETVPGGTFKGRPELQAKYAGLHGAILRQAEFHDLSKTGEKEASQAIWEYLYGKLRSGTIIARGFAVPHKGGSNEIVIKPSEWRVLEVDGPSGSAVEKGSTGSVVYSGIQLARRDTPAFEITFDPSNPGKKFWSLEPNRDKDGNLTEGSHWEYRALIRNVSHKTLRNVKVTVEAIGAMPTRPEPSHFDYNKQPLIDIDPQDERLAVIRTWWNPPVMAGDAGSGAYGPIKMTASADDVSPEIKLFWFEPGNTPMISEIPFRAAAHELPSPQDTGSGIRR